MNENRAGTGKLFEDETFTAKETGAQISHQRHVELYRALREQKCVALRHNTLAGRQFEGLNLSRVVSRESDFTWTHAVKVGQEQRLSSNGAPKRAQQFFTKCLAAHTRFPLSVIRLLIHFAVFSLL